MIFISNRALAQEPIATERPTQSIGHLVLPGNSFQFEQGFTYTDTLVLDGFFRLGVSDIGELRLLTYYDSPQVTIGAKVKLLKARDYRPGIAIRVEMTGFQVSDYRFVYDQKISDNFNAIVNFGNARQFYGIFYVGYSFAGRYGTYLEAYFENGYSQYNTGLTLRIDPETQIDLNAGLMNYDQGYIGVGFGRRFILKE
jgi:hypothetical protein